MTMVKKTIFLILDHDCEIVCATEYKEYAQNMIDEIGETEDWTIEETVLHCEE